MREHVTIIPADNMIIVDGVALQCAFAAPDNVHALQWHKGKGHVEYTDGTPNRTIAPNGYPELVAPFVVAWEAEKSRLEAEANRLPTLAEAKARAEESIKQARDRRLEDGGMVWNGYLVSIDKEATDRMTSVGLQFVTFGDHMPAVRWKMSDGEYALLDRDAFFAMSIAAGGVVQQCYSVEEKKRQEVAVLPDARAILDWLAIPANLVTGWPGGAVGT